MARDEGIPVGGLGVLLVAPQIIEQAVLRQFKGLVLLADAGLIVGAIGGIWSRYLPSV